MLSKIKIERYKSLYDTEIDLEPLTVFIGANGSGKSNICEALLVLSNFLQNLLNNQQQSNIVSFLKLALNNLYTNKKQNVEQKIYGQLISKAVTTDLEPPNINIITKLWHQELNYLAFEINVIDDKISLDQTIPLSIKFDFTQQKFFIGEDLNISFNNLLQDNIEYKTKNFTSIPIKIKNYNQILKENLIKYTAIKALKKVKIYDFYPFELSLNSSDSDYGIERTGKGITYALVDILHKNRQQFDELEERFTQLIPNIKRISLPLGENRTFRLELIDKYSDKPIPTHDISDGTLRILAFLTALYEQETPSIICFEEPENGIHPWLLNKIMELLKIVSTEGITGKPVQVLITTHSPLLLNYVEPHQIRVVKLDTEGKTQVSPLPLDSPRFQKALEAYDGGLGEIWFTDIFGGNP